MWQPRSRNSESEPERMSPTSLVILTSALVEDGSEASCVEVGKALKRAGPVRDFCGMVVETAGECSVLCDDHKYDLHNIENGDSVLKFEKVLKRVEHLVPKEDLERNGSHQSRTTLTSFLANIKHGACNDKACGEVEVKGVAYGCEEYGQMRGSGQVYALEALAVGCGSSTLKPSLKLSLQFPLQLLPLSPAASIVYRCWAI
ncbi:hypothetical protein BDQ17DRAFT_1327436 [Cyathus striatus]|nr:hypothetical protein BDQ17DRAFT_1327436 [Cyathus striatus]